MSHQHGHTHSPGARRLAIALCILFAFTVVEAAGGLVANSIALLAEAGHMLADCASLLLAISAVRLARRPPSATRTYGHHRYQTLAAFVNGLALLALTLWVAFEASERLISPPHVKGGLMLGVALAGGAANLAAFTVLSGASSLNERGARAHVLGDLLGSAAAVAAAVAVVVGGIYVADPILSLLVSVLIFRSAWQLTRESAHVLLEGAPTGRDATRIEQALGALSGIAGVHHVHAWSLTGDQALVTLHAELQGDADPDAALRTLRERLREQLGIEHATVQIERDGCAPGPPEIRSAT